MTECGRKEDAGGGRPSSARAGYTLTALAEEFRPALLRYFSRRVRQSEEVEDLVQEVLARLVRRCEVVEMEAVRAYVFETASSVLIDWARRRRSRRADDHGELSADQPAPGDFTADRILLGRERLQRVTAALLELPERQRSIGAFPPHPRHDEGAPLLPQAAQHLKRRLVEPSAGRQSIAPLKRRQRLCEPRRGRIAGRADLMLDQRHIGLPAQFSRSERAPFQRIQGYGVRLGDIAPRPRRAVADLGALNIKLSIGARLSGEGGDGHDGEDAGGRFPHTASRPHDESRRNPRNALYPRSSRVRRKAAW